MTGACIAGGRRIALTPVAQVGPDTSGGTGTAATNHVVTLPTVPGGILANDLIVIWCTLNKGSVATMNPACSGYAELYDAQVTRGTVVNGVSAYAKVAAGGETTATIIAATTVTSHWVARVYRGATGLPSVVTPVMQANLTGTLLSNTVTPVKTTDIIMTHAGFRTISSGAALTAFGGGASASFTTLSGRNVDTALGIQTGTVAATTHNCTASSVDGGASIGMASIVIKSVA